MRRRGRREDRETTRGPDDPARAVEVTLADVRGEQFEKTDVRLDGNAYHGCTFVRCRVIYAAESSTRLHGVAFEECEFVFEGAALRGLEYLQSLYHGGGDAGPVVVREFTRLLERGVVGASPPSVVAASRPPDDRAPEEAGSHSEGQALEGQVLEEAESEPDGGALEEAESEPDGGAPEGAKSEPDGGAPEDAESEPDDGQASVEDEDWVPTDAS